MLHVFLPPSVFCFRVALFKKEGVPWVLKNNLSGGESVDSYVLVDQFGTHDSAVLACTVEASKFMR